MLQVIALGADPTALNLLTTFCCQSDLVTYCQTFTQAEEIRYYLHHHPVDLLLIDVDLPTESGLRFWQTMRQQRTDYPATAEGQLPMVIFTAASPQHAAVSYDLDAIDYLVKPFAADRFAQAIQKAAMYAHWQRLSSAGKTTLTVRTDSGLVRVPLTEIMWVEALSNYLKICLVDQRLLIVRMTMKTMLTELPSADFVRVHRSYIVAVSQVHSVRNKLIQIGGKQIPISSNYEPDFGSRLRAYQPSSLFLSSLSHNQSWLQQPYTNIRNTL